VSRCRHRGDRVTAMTGPQIDSVNGVAEIVGHYSIHECNICDDCGEWLSLGPSNDDSEAVRIEIRAAQLAADDECIWSPEEIGGGYVAACWEPGVPFSDRLDSSEQHAGYLAWLITHDDEQRAASEVRR